MFCDQCGAAVEPGAKFCEECGSQPEEWQPIPREPSRRKRALPWQAIRMGGTVILAVLLVILIISRLGPDSSPTRLLPGNALLYAEVTGVSSLVQEVNQLLQEVSRTSGKDLKAEFSRELQSQNLEDFFQTLSQIHSLHLCVVDFAVPALEKELGGFLSQEQEIEAWLPSMVLLVDFGSKGTIVELFENRFLPRLKAQLPPEFQLFRTEFQGHPLYQLDMQLRSPGGFGSVRTQGLSLFATFFQGYFLLSPQRRLLERLLDNSRENSGVLEEDPLFIKTRAYRPRRGAWAYLNITPIWSKLDNLVSLIPRGEGRKARRVLEEIRLQDFKTLTLAVDPSVDVITLTGHIQIDPDNPLARIFRQSPRDWRELLAVIPDGVTQATFFAVDDPVRTWREATALISRLEGIAGESTLRPILGAWERELGRIGIDLERDLLAYLGHTPALLFWNGGGGLLLRAYPNNPEALKAMRAQAKWRNAR
jgi:hypothetical protein